MTSARPVWPRSLLEISWLAGPGRGGGEGIIWLGAGGAPKHSGLPAAWFVFLTPGSWAVTRCLLSEVIGN